jgi:ubiquitin-protein ligase E3 B
MFGKAEINKNTFLEEKQKNRTNRLKQIEFEKRRDEAILIIQKIVRGWLARTKFKRKLL